MAKGSKPVGTNKVNPYILFAISVMLLSAAFLMRSFPVLIFAALAPLFAVADHADGTNFWNKVELAGAAFVLSLFAWYEFDLNMAVPAVLEGIAIALTFLAYTFSRRGLGSTLGKLTLVIFWLAMEYLLLKFLPARPVFFLADAVYLKVEWLRWTNSTGYLGASLWILLANLLLYLGLFRSGLRIGYLIAFLIVILGPIFYSYTLQTDYATRLQMILLYMDGPTRADGYQARGEWIPRTAAWISVLILLSAFVKDNIRKK